ncbi:MAG: 30S ribosomal protein S4 [Flavobacteriales bacterium]|nr:30S ribosomal protein S4 [Flavobacteriales bacterium]|tara:strand:- start:36874 stop:37476 length:603 start_codon:yes stop_codon:yes gene_type:complete
MARHRGPQSKIARRFGEPIFGPDKALERRNYGPGQHGNNRRAKKSEYAGQLAEKQKAKYTYGILERQFSNLFKEASRRKGITGEILLQLCEARLDNIVYRLGIAPTRRAARQLVTHRHITVNGEVMNIPSYSVNLGDDIAVREKSKSLEVVTSSLANTEERCEYVQWNPDTMTGKLAAIPERTQIPENIKEQLIVELYSK